MLQDQQPTPLLRQAETYFRSDRLKLLLEIIGGIGQLHVSYRLGRVISRAAGRVGNLAEETLIDGRRRGSQADRVHCDALSPHLIG